MDVLEFVFEKLQSVDEASYSDKINAGSLSHT